MTIALLLGPVLTACGGDDDDDAGTGGGSGGGGGGGEEVSVGLINNLTGAGETYGIPFDNGFNLALADIEESGYLSDEDLSLAVDAGDSGSEVPGAVTLFNEDVAADADIIVSAGVTPLSLAMSPLANESEVPFVSGAATSTPEDDFAFNLSDGATQTQTLADYLVDQGHERIALIVDADNDFFVGAAEAFREAFGDGAEVVADETVAQADADFSAVLTNIASADPDAVILLTLGQQSGNIIVQMDQSGDFADAQIVAGPSAGTEVYDIAGDAAVGVVLPTLWAPGGDATGDFESAYTDEYGEPPVSYSAVGYQAAWLIAVAAKTAAADGEVTRESLRDALGTAAGSDDLAEHGPIQEFSLDDGGQAKFPGAVAVFDDTGALVAAGDG